MTTESKGSRPRTWVARGVILTAVISAALFAPAASLADWRKDAKEAALDYAEEKKNEVTKALAKDAVFTLYKRLYTSEADRSLARTLADVAISAPELNKLATEVGEAYASGDSEKMRKASQKVAVEFGKKLTELASNPKTEKQFKKLIGQSKNVEKISTMLGNVAAGTEEGRRAAAEYIGQALINVSPGGAVVGFYQSAYGAMKYANDEFVDSKVEDFYKAYKAGDAAARELLIDQLRSGTGGYRYVVEKRREDLEQERTAAIRDAAGVASERVREHLTRTTEGEVIDNIVASFDSRLKKERQDAARQAEATKAQKQAETILDELNFTARGRNGIDWYEKTPVDLKKFTSIVRNQLKADGVLDPENPLHVQLMSKALSTALIYGKSSKEYEEVQEELAETKESILATNKGAPCTDDSPAQALALRLWQKGKQLVAAGKVKAALPVFKQSLEYCPDEDRAAQVAELAKLATPSVNAFDGTYIGQLTLVSLPRRPFRPESSLQLTIKGGNVSGSFTHKAVFDDAVLTRQGSIAGRISEDGRFTGTVTGKSFESQRQRTGATGMFDCPLEGKLTGRLDDKTLSGALSTTDTRKTILPGCNQQFNWRASRK